MTCRHALAIAFVLGSACSSSDELTVTIDTGTLHGTKTGGIRSFLGIPYAAPPVGDLRWRTPQPAAKWKGTLQAIEVGSQCPQTLSLSGPSDDEDCLYLNVWTPSGAHDLPVMVWLHGGAFIFGSGGDKYYAGGPLASHGVVIVTINYRIGPFGFMAHPGLDAEDPDYPTSGNYGFEDQRVALEWVQRNIRAFGGDPEHVTLFGESAGGYSTCVQYVSSRTAGLFEDAISESGFCTSHALVLDKADAEQQGVTLGTQLGCPGSDASAIACMRQLTSDQLLAATQPPQPVNQMPGGPLFADPVLPASLPSIDGYVVSAPLDMQFASGTFTPRPLLLGTNKNEGTLLVSDLYAKPVSSDDEYQAALAVRFGAANVPAIIAMYPSSAFPSPNDALAQVAGDAFFVCAARKTARGAAAAGASVYRYTFVHPIANPISQDLGVFHSSEIPYVFGNDDFPLGAIGDDGQPLVDTMQGYWTSFAKHGGDPDDGVDPDWPMYDVATDPYQSLDLGVTSGTGLETSACDFWDSLPM